jgi:hypothetical protein
VIDRDLLIRLAGDPACTTFEQLCAQAGCRLPDLREALAADAAFAVAFARADAERTAILVSQALEAEKLTPPQLLALAASRHGDPAKGFRSVLQEHIDPSGADELERLLRERDPALTALLERHGFVARG